VDFAGVKNPRANVLDLETRISPSLIGLSIDMISEEQEQKEKVISRIKEFISNQILCNTSLCLRFLVVTR
jgi:hypothetical protein